MKAKSYIKLLVQKSSFFMKNNSSSLTATLCVCVRRALCRRETGREMEKEDGRARIFLAKIYHFKYCADRLQLQRFSLCKTLWKKDCIETKYFLGVFESSVNLISAEFLTEKLACCRRSGSISSSSTATATEYGCIKFIKLYVNESEQ